MSVTALRTIPNLLRRAFPTRRGWIGVDFGTRCIKLAQVSWTGSTCRIVARWVLTADDAAATSDESPRDACQLDSAQLQAARKVFQGVNAAAALPMSALALRTIDAPPGTLDETASMIEQDLLTDLPNADEGVVFDFWEVPTKDARAAGSQRFAVLAAGQPTVTRYAQALSTAGYDSRVFDGAPCVLARAVQLAGECDVASPVAAIDLGYSSPLFVVAADGKPLFTRQLRGCEVNSFAGPICASLEISLAQAETLLGRFGVRGSASAESSAAEIATRHLVAEPMERLVAELQRTLAYLSQQARDLLPQRLWLLGGGATWPGMAEYLAGNLGVPVRPWALSGGPGDRGDALFGMAAALSALAEEDSQCM